MRKLSWRKVVTVTVRRFSSLTYSFLRAFDCDEALKKNCSFGTTWSYLKKKKRCPKFDRKNLASLGSRISVKATENSTIKKNYAFLYMKEQCIMMYSMLLKLCKMKFYLLIYFYHLYYYLFYFIIYY